MEFIINTDLEKTIPAVIDFNFEELRGWLGSQLSHYNALVVTEDTIKEGKEERAKLNKLKTAVEDRRKEVKKLCLAPYESFEAKCKELVGMIDEASNSIDGQVKSFEEAEKAEKRAAIEAAYGEYAGDMAGLLPLEKIFNQKWLNKTVLLAAAVAEMQAIIGKARNDIKVIRAMSCACEDQMVSAYLERLDMSAALMEKNRYEARQEQLARMAEREAAAAPVVHDAGAPGFDLRDVKPGEVVSFGGATESAPPLGGEIKTIEVVFYDTTAAFRADMKALTERHNIKYGGIQG